MGKGNANFGKMRKSAQINETHSVGKIPASATQVKQSTDNNAPFFSFEHLCENNFMIINLGKIELKELHAFLKRSSGMPWNQVRQVFKYKIIPRKGLSCRVPDSVPDDASISEMRVTNEHRIFGFRTGSVFNIIWFDPTHDVCPEGKKKRF